MKIRMFKALAIFAVVVFGGLSASLLADGLNNNEVEFTGTISSVAVNGEGVGTIFIRLEDFDLRVMVIARTELHDQDGDDVQASDLKPGLRIAVTGKYSSSGIVASRIRFIGNSAGGFDIRGHITGVQPSGDNLMVSLLGITVTVAPGTSVEADGVKVPLSSLKTGVFVQIRGSQAGAAWNAESVKIISPDKKREKVRFEGTVKAIKEDTLQVAITGLTDGVTSVLLTPNTRIVGQPALNLTILVIGVLNPDLSVTAMEIRVLQALEIKPDERKLKVGASAVFTVKLRETAAADVVVALKSGDVSVLSLSASSLTIPKGGRTGDFSAKGIKVGSTEITAEALSQKATAGVRVGEVSEDESERPAGEVRMEFAPGKIRMKPNESRDVVLLVKPPLKAAAVIEFKAPGDIVKVAATRELGSGAAEMKVTIQAGSKDGSGSVVAALAEVKDGAKAELLVEVEAGDAGTEAQKVEIDFRPDEIKVDSGDSGAANLMMSRSLDREVVVAIAPAAPGASSIIEVAQTVKFPAGTKLVPVTVKGKVEGKAVIVASLPESLGGDTAKLSVEVRSRK